MSNSHRINTPKGEMSGNGSGPPIAHLPPVMKQMFAPGPPLEAKPPVSKRKMPPYSGIAAFVSEFETTTPEPRPPFEDVLQRRARVNAEKAAAEAVKLEEDLGAWDPHKPPAPLNGELTGDAYKTLFVARISHDTTERKLRREFEQFGAIKTLRLVQNSDGDCRGYAFIEYEKEADMKEAYKKSDGRKIDGRRVVVDVERGRTVRKWKPRRFAGGLGNTRDSKKKGDKPGPTLSGRASSGPSSSASAGHYGSGGGGGHYGSGGCGGGGGHYGGGGCGGGGGGGDRPPAAPAPTYQYSGAMGGAPIVPYESGRGGGGGDRYGGGGGGDRYGGGGDRERRRSRSRGRDGYSGGDRSRRRSRSR